MAMPGRQMGRWRPQIIPGGSAASTSPLVGVVEMLRCQTTLLPLDRRDNITPL